MIGYSDAGIEEEIRKARLAGCPPDVTYYNFAFGWVRKDEIVSPKTRRELDRLVAELKGEKRPPKPPPGFQL
jgi:hypothetical protein